MPGLVIFFLDGGAPSAAHRAEPGRRRRRSSSLVGVLLLGRLPRPDLRYPPSQFLPGHRLRAGRRCHLGAASSALVRRALVVAPRSTPSATWSTRRIAAASSASSACASPPPWASRWPATWSPS
ncbi:MAG: hypothetical protein MZW92_52955 [Comamonadaceae bacterium]|nr:hypothetical protein [Comamonadaceae bacterium]